MLICRQKHRQTVNNNGEPKEGLQYRYEHEPAPRWRAGDNLTCRQLPAYRVRLEEYRLAFEHAADKRFLNDETNGAYPIW